MAELLAQLIRKNNPRAKIPKELTKWATALDRLHRLDGEEQEGKSVPIPWSEIEHVLRWGQQDEFWQTNILSAGTLRKQYGQLWAKMKADGNGQSGGRRGGTSSVDERAITEWENDRP